MLSTRARQRGRRRASFRPPRGMSRSAIPPPWAAGQDLATHSTREPRGERRQVTVLFCDLVGSTELAERLDPEELCEVMRHYQATCAQAIAPFGGYLAQTLGDGLLFYFGFPSAHEDDPVRAVRAGLAAIAAVYDPTRAPIRTSSRCAVRVGIHTGLVYAGEVGQFDTRAEHALVGDTPNIAQRLQSLAAPNELLLGPTTRKLIEAHFRLESLGPQTIKGLSAPLEVFRARGESSAATRFASRSPDSWAPLVGRDREFAELRTRWTQAQLAQGQTVVLSGVAGIGKSRLAEALRGTLTREAQIVSFQCSAYSQSAALHPLVSMLRRVARIRAKDPSDLKLTKLQRVLGDDSARAERNVALLARLLRIPHLLAPELDQLSGDRLLAETIDWAVSWLITQSRKQPVLAVLEDAHWSDPATRRLMTQAARALIGSRVMLLITERSGFVELGRLKGAITLVLPALQPADSNAIVQHFASTTHLGRRVIDEIVVRSGGIPFFVEELTKAVLESSDSGTRRSVPPTLKDSLMARLDNAGPFKMIAQRAACIGPQFSHAMVAHVSGLDERTLRRGLDKLIELELLTRLAETPDVRYAFRHSLLQEAAYESLLLQERPAQHQ
jgi:class 3 adenylate cyclase/energy-coupling factor transporter ATP-binding protein EcfA2